MANHTPKGDTGRLRCLRAIIFDLDGVIADTEDLHRQAYNLAFAEAGIPVRWTFEDYRARLVLSAGTKLREIAPRDGKCDSSEFHRHLYSRKRKHYVDLLHGADLTTRPGILRLIDEALSKGLPIGAASTCAKEGALAILQRCLGQERVRGLTCIRAGDDAPRRKPAPDIYLLALSDLGASPSGCVAIEDTRHGVEAAKAAGLWTLVTPSQYTRSDDFSQADLVVDDLNSGGIDLLRLDHELSIAAQIAESVG